MACLPMPILTPHLPSSVDVFLALSSVLFGSAFTFRFLLRGERYRCLTGPILPFGLDARSWTWPIKGRMMLHYTPVGLRTMLDD